MPVRVKMHFESLKSKILKGENEKREKNFNGPVAMGNYKKSSKIFPKKTISCQNNLGNRISSYYVSIPFKDIGKRGNFPDSFY